MGTPEFAVPTLQLLLERDDIEIVAVITATDKPGGRGRNQLLESAVKKVARQHNLVVIQPKNLKATEFVERYHNLEADLAVVVAFRMLPEVIWSAPKHGTINLHASLLPAYRGAAPINWAIINGEKETGLTTFKIAKEIDTGGIIFQSRMRIKEEDTAGTLHDRMMYEGAHLVSKTVDAIKEGTVQYIAQDDDRATKAPKIFTEDCQIDPSNQVRQIYDFVRGLSPYPGAWIIIDHSTVKIYKCEYNLIDHHYQMGSLISDNKNFLKLYGKDGYLKINELQMQGKKRMDIKSFLNGFDVARSQDVDLEIG
ncbi:MAG: methionyl-tRNA formyltransferase [Saprospiraceae bacterium]|nr:methionyl-tRNA formyltransferase [Saprospiraceae bacterium]